MEETGCIGTHYSTANATNASATTRGLLCGYVGVDRRRDCGDRLSGVDRFAGNHGRERKEGKKKRKEPHGEQSEVGACDSKVRCLFSPALCGKS